MCSPSAMKFAGSVLAESDVAGRRVLEVGALDVNGSVRPLVEALGPAAYVGTDLTPGPGVDVICDATDLVARFGPASFEILICTEVLEHVRDWKAVIHNFKEVVTPGGILIITTRSFGVDFHRHPFDFWRYEPADIEVIFSDLAIERLLPDPDDPGIFLRARKPTDFRENDLRGYRLYSILRRKRIVEARGLDLALFHVRYRLIRLLQDLLPRRFRRTVRERLLR